MMDRRGKKTKGTGMAVLTEDLVTEILLRLPVKSLLAFKIACKLWCSIIDSPEFIRRHRDRAKTALYNKHKSFIGIDIPYWLDDPNILFKEESEGFQAEEFVLPAQNLLKRAEGFMRIPRARNSCDGLVCFQVEHCNSVVIWKPCFPSDCKVINTSVDKCSVGFGFDPSTDDCKVVCLPYDPVEKCTGETVYVHVFSLKRKSWKTLTFTKTVDFVIANLDTNEMVYSGNRLYWLAREIEVGDGAAEIEYANETPLIAYFDLVQETLGYLNLCSTSNLPKVPINYKDTLGIAGRGNFYGTVEVWVLKHCNGMDSKWTKMLKISCSGFTNSNYCFCYTSRGELLVSRASGLAIIDGKDGSLKKDVYKGDSMSSYVKNGDLQIYAFPHVESLVSPTMLQ